LSVWLFGCLTAWFEAALLELREKLNAV